MAEDPEKATASSVSDKDLEGTLETPQLPTLDTKPESEWTSVYHPSFPSQQCWFELRREACLCLLGSTLLLFCTVGLVNAFGVFQEYYAQTFLSDHTPSQISWLGSFALFTMFAGTFPVGYLNDKYGPVVSFCLHNKSRFEYWLIFVTRYCCVLDPSSSSLHSLWSPFVHNTINYFLHKASFLGSDFLSFYRQHSLPSHDTSWNTEV